MIQKIKMITSRKMLQSNIINVAQNVLHSQFSTNGLEDTTLGLSLAYTPADESGFVQIIHDDDIHWIRVSNIGCPMMSGRLIVFSLAG